MPLSPVIDSMAKLGFSGKLVRFPRVYPAGRCVPNRGSSATFIRYEPIQAGFSLIELVVVISILGVLVAIALPRYLNVQKDAKISQAKNALATIVKECVVELARGRSASMGDIRSAKASLPGYQLEYQNIVQGTPAFNALSCVNVISGNFYANPTELVPQTIFPAMPWFMIKHDQVLGDTSKKCGYYDGIAGLYKGGCDAPQPGPCNGPSCPPPGQGWVEAEW